MNSFLMLFISLTVQATTINFVNHTGAKMRIVDLSDKCGKRLVNRSNPVFIEKGFKVTFKDVSPVIHTYEICGSGFCSLSAMGFNKNTKNMIMDVVLEDGIITANPRPNVFPGNMDCK